MGTDKKIYALYFDKDGNGPTSMVIAPYDFKDLKPPAFGLNFQFNRALGNFNVNDAPVGGGFFFAGNNRSSLEALHAQIGAWLEANPRTEPDDPEDDEDASADADAPT